VDDITDFVSEFFEEERPPRKNGQPLLIPRGVDIADENRVAYSRASGLADHLEDFSFLWKWKMRGLAKGLADRMDLVRLVAAEDYTTGFAEDEAANRAAGRRIDEVIERALDQSGTDQKADYGTAIHARTEPGNEGTDPDEKQRIDVASCWDLWKTLGVVHLGTEVFTANDETRSAGTFDHLSYVPGLGIVITDKKTSSKAKQNYDVQLGSYANSDVYDPQTDQRQTLEEFVAAAGWDPALLNRDVGIIWWVKDGRTQARQLDLVNGWRWAKVAATIRDERRPQASRVAKDVTKTLAKGVEEQRSNLTIAITTSNTLEGLLGIWNHPAAQAIWTDHHTECAKAQKEALQSRG
jgi:hypothetical protein